MADENNQNTYYTPNQENPQQGYNQFDGAPQPPKEDKASVILAILSYLIPIVGLVLYCTQKEDKPKAAKVYGKCALASVIINVVIAIVSNVLVAVLGLGAASAAGLMY